jgi:hypothetical protein
MVEHFLCALNLYCKLPFGKLHKGNPIIIETAEKMNRTPNSLAMKLCNFAALDSVWNQRAALARGEPHQVAGKFPAERLNPRNGLCLSSLHDAAFDAGFITLDSKLNLVLGKRLRSVFPPPALVRNFVPFDGQPIHLPEKVCPARTRFSSLPPRRSFSEVIGEHFLDDAEGVTLVVPGELIDVFQHEGSGQIRQRSEESGHRTVAPSATTAILIENFDGH